MMAQHNQQDASEDLEKEIASYRAKSQSPAGNSLWTAIGRITGILLMVLTGVILWELAGLPHFGFSRIIAGLLGLPVWIVVFLIFKDVPIIKPALIWLFPNVMTSPRQAPSSRRMIEIQTEDESRTMWTKFEATRGKFKNGEIDAAVYGSEVRKLIARPPDGLGNIVVKIQRTKNQDLESDVARISSKSEDE